MIIIMRLTKSQILSFYENDYLLLEEVLNEDDISPVMEEYSSITDKRAQQLYKEGKLSELFADEPFERRLLSLAREAPQIAEGLDIMQERGVATFNFLKNPKILDLAESLVGSEFVCNPIQHIRAVLPHQQTGTRPSSWHQDAGVCWPDADPYFMLTIWVPLVDATLENGCLEVMPRSHTDGLRQHTQNSYGLGIIPEDLPSIEPQPLPLHRGGVILFHNYTLHHARPNETDAVRWSFDLHYNDAYQPTGRPFYPAFLMRSKLRPEAAQTNYETWRQRWEFALRASHGAKHYRWSL